MMIKFRYVYSNGKEIKTFIYTIKEIEKQDMLTDWLLMEDGFKLISRDRYIGLKDKYEFTSCEDCTHKTSIDIEYCYKCSHSHESLFKKRDK